MGGLRGIDMFRKIPADLTSATTTGAILSVAAAAFMAFLFVVELWAFLGSTVQTGVILDANTDTLLRINFNVTMLDLPCEYAAVPEAKFSYDLSPMAVAVRTSGKRWYDFVTSICAIVGGCVEIKFHVAFVLNLASSSTPSTRRLLDGVAMPVSRRSTEPARPRHRREMT